MLRLLWERAKKREAIGVEKFAFGFDFAGRRA